MYGTPRAVLIVYRDMPTTCFLALQMLRTRLNLLKRRSLIYRKAGHVQDDMVECVVEVDLYDFPS